MSGFRGALPWEHGFGAGVVLCKPKPRTPPTLRPPSSSSGVAIMVEPSPEVPEGTTATMTCSAIPWVGEEANYTWYKNNRWLQEGPDGSIILARVSSADTGSYRCRASGTRGSTASATLSFNVLCECPPAPRGQDGAQSPPTCWVHPAQHHTHPVLMVLLQRGGLPPPLPPLPALLLSLWTQGRGYWGFV